MQDPSFDLDAAQQSSLLLREGIKFVALVWHLLTAVAIFLLVARVSGEKLAAAVGERCTCSNPAALYDVAHWGSA